VWTTTSSFRDPHRNQPQNKPSIVGAGQSKAGATLPLQHFSDTSADEARYNGTVRRALSIVLLLLFSLPLISPALALTDISDANLPACCRRNGAHHCTKITSPANSSGSGLSFSAIPPRCPAYPAAVTPVRHGDLSFHAASLIFAGIVSHPVIKPQTEARARVALDLSRQKRGPPPTILL
jgi:hypothetical protein